MESESATCTKRWLLVGGLSPSVSERDIKKLFKPFGKVKEVVRKKKNEAVVELSSSSAQVQNCISRYHHSEWKGGRLNIRIVDHKMSRDDQSVGWDCTGGVPDGTKPVLNRWEGVTPTVNGASSGEEWPTEDMTVQKLEFSSDDELATQLQLEKTNALSILNSVLQANPTEQDKEVPKATSEDLSVSPDLKTLFGDQKNVPHAFNFQTSDIESDTLSEGGAVSLEGPTKVQLSGSGVIHRPKKLLYFHYGNDKLKNRVRGNWFYRSKSLEELETGWSERRAAMWQACRTRHKEAVRMARKSRKRLRPSQTN